MVFVSCLLFQSVVNIIGKYEQQDKNSSNKSHHKNCSPLAFSWLYQINTFGKGNEREKIQLTSTNGWVSSISEPFYHWLL